MKTSNFPLLTLATIIALAASTAVAGNLLVNTNFGANGYANHVPNGWTFYEESWVGSVHDYWCDYANGGGYCGTYYWKQWFPSEASNNVSGIFQVDGSAPGSVYQAGGWFETYSGDAFGADCFTWVQVTFLDSGNNALAVYKSDNFNITYGESQWVYLPVTNACDVTQPVSLNDPYFTNYYAVTGSVSQILAPVGTTLVRYDYSYFEHQGEGGSSYFDCAYLNLISGPVPPVISSIYPVNMILVPPSSNVSFTVSSPSGVTIPTNNIHLTLNGTDVTSSVTISGSASSKNALYTLLQSNQTYNVSITVTDADGLATSAATTFQTTWVGIPPVAYLWEAEDWDFTNGMYIDFPDLCNAAGDPNCYFDKTGVQYVDENSDSDTGSHDYRTNDLICTLTSGDSFRPNLYAAGRPDYAINPFVTGEWVNYTRDWSNGTYNVYARAAANLASSGSATMALVTDDSTNELGTFTINSGLGFTTFENVPLLDTNGNAATVVLNGKATLQVTEVGDFLPTFYALVAVAGDLPLLSGMYPTGKRPFEYTNAFTFNVTTRGATFPANGIRLNLDGFDVTSNLVITGSSSNKTVVYPLLLPNAIHVAVITVTNSLNHGITVTDQFDTFSESNYMVECEDFDYGGGQYITPWFPDCYADYNGPYNAETNIDFTHTSLAGEVFYYRAIGIPQDVLNRLTYQDYVRQVFVNAGAQDFVLVFFAGGDWANYTRNYPAGGYYVYVRTSGNAGTTNLQYLGQVVSGGGTTNENGNQLGVFADVGQGYNTFQWVPLTDDGLSAPVLVGLKGVTTLRFTTAGNANPNFFMFVPAAGIRLTAARSGTDNVLAFPSQAGVNYRVFYRTSLTTGNWTLLTTVPGNGAVQHVSDPFTASGSRFYEVVAP